MTQVINAPTARLRVCGMVAIAKEKQLEHDARKLEKEAIAKEKQLESEARKLEKEAIAKENQLEREGRKLEKEVERVAPKKQAATPKKKPAPTYKQIQQESACHQAKLAKKERRSEVFAAKLAKTARTSPATDTNGLKAAPKKRAHMNFFVLVSVRCLSLFVGL